MTLLSFQKAEIPLPEGMDQTGYIARFGGAVGVLDRPEIKVLLLKESLSVPSVLVFCDLLGLSPAHTRKLEKQIARIAGTTENNVSVTCTHTHSAPAMMSLLLLGECRDSATREFEETLFDTVRKALGAAFVPTRLLFAKTNVEGVARNRVRGNETDVDEDATLLVFETKEKKIALINYACHPVTKNADNRLYSRDYPGVVTDTLINEGLFDEVIFATAPCGDLNPILQDEPGEHARMQEYGTKIARNIAKLVENRVLMETEGFSMEKKPVRLPLAEHHVREDLDLTLSRAAVGRLNATDAVKQKYEEANYLWALSHKRLKDFGLSEDAFTFSATVLHFGALTVLGLPFELFSDIGMRLKERFAPAMVWELCGGDYGYFASDELWDKAAYERGDAYMYYNHAAPMKKGSELTLTEALL